MATPSEYTMIPATIMRADGSTEPAFICRIDVGAYHFPPLGPGDKIAGESVFSGPRPDQEADTPQIVHRDA